MSLPSLTDVAVYSGLAAVALWPAVLPYIKKIRLPGRSQPTKDQWQADSVAGLIALQGDLEARKMAPAVKLCRELIWEILGGDAV